MQDTSLTLQPQRYEFRAEYLSIDLSRVKNSVERLISDSALYFSKPLDDASFEVINGEGVIRETVSISDVTQVFDLVGETTGQVTLRLSIGERTPNFGWKVPPQEYLDFTIDFSRRAIFSNISILGLERAGQIGKILTEGIVLVNVQLPPQHRYIEPYLLNLLKDFPSTNQNVFLIMRFDDTPPFPEIVEAVRTTCTARGLNVLRADDKEYTDDLWDNVLTYMYGCDFAIAIFDQANYREFNPNVALEVGFLRAKCKRVLLLKDKAIPSLPADVVSKIYKNFDTYAVIGTIPPQINKWLDDYGIGSAGSSVLPSS